jgi:hypothetical protein
MVSRSHHLCPALPCPPPTPHAHACTFVQHKTHIIPLFIPMGLLTPPSHISGRNLRSLRKRQEGQCIIGGIFPLFSNSTSVLRRAQSLHRVPPPHQPIAPALPAATCGLAQHVRGDVLGVRAPIHARTTVPAAREEEVRAVHLPRAARMQPGTATHERAHEVAPAHDLRQTRLSRVPRGYRSRRSGARGQCEFAC